MESMTAPPAAARVRAAGPADAGDIAGIYRPYVEGSVVSFEEAAPDAAEIQRRMLARPALPWLVAVRDGRTAGYAYACAHRSRAAYRWAVDVSVYLAAAEHRRGTGRTLYQHLLRQLRELGYQRAYAGVALPNPASVGLHESLGFAPVGVYHKVGYKFGGWHDVGWWELALAEDVSPAEPREWSGNRND